ncbi:MAG: nuclear transport factor 2 family protein [Candidatus Binatia bacterium]
MGPMSRFFEYAQDFELAFDDDDWSRLARHFAADAVYEVRNTSFACRIEGRDAIFRGFKKSLDGFDRKLPKRSVEITDPPAEDGERMTVGWSAIYDKPGAPRLVLRGRSTARYRGDVIAELVDEYPDGMGAEAERWAREHAPGLDASYV